MDGRPRQAAAGERGGVTTEREQEPGPGAPGEPLAEEQARLDTVYTRLDALRVSTAGRLAQVRRAGASGSPQNRSERDAFATLYEDRLAQLDSVEERLVFGRLYLRGGDSLYVGRIGLSDDRRVPLLTDWRAPAARPFYQATAAAPGDVVRRRHLLTRARRVVSVEDEVLDLDRLEESDVDSLSGEGALLAALGARRTGRMSDIVATIQSEQDAIIRDELAGVLVVQGGPGTGKTAVALHRAAFLLYAHREKLERSGVLLLGPSRVFLRYIEQVLPSLGETGVVATTVADLLPGFTATGSEPEEVAEIKGRPVMARVVARAVRARERVPDEPQEIRVGRHVLLVTPEDVREAQAKARRASSAHNKARVTFVRSMLSRLAAQYAAALGGSLAPEDLADLAEEIRTTREARVVLNLAWMPLSPQSLLADLWAKPARLAQAAPELTDRERRLLARDRDAPWTAADVPLLDEAAELLGVLDAAAAAAITGVAAGDEGYAAEVLDLLGADEDLHPDDAGLQGMLGMVNASTLAGLHDEVVDWTSTAERAAADREWTYGHVIVDEAQELSAMAWRMVMRRCPMRSMTLVGDLAQTSDPAGALSWSRMLRPYVRGRFRVEELTVNYRTPAEIMTIAEPVLAAIDPELRAPRSVRDAGLAPAHRRVASADLPAQVVDVVREEDDEPGTIGVLVPRARYAAVADAVERARSGGPALAESADSAGGQPSLFEMVDTAAELRRHVVVLTVMQAKGLEFDSVIVADPAGIIAESARGLSDLYVALTRTTQRLTVLHTGELPAVLGRLREPAA